MTGAKGTFEGFRTECGVTIHYNEQTMERMWAENGKQLIILLEWPNKEWVIDW